MFTLREPPGLAEQARLTNMLVEHETLASYRYLEHGAFYTIIALEKLSNRYHNITNNCNDCKTGNGSGIYFLNTRYSSALPSSIIK
jgi:hypothetical protein